MAKFCLPMRVDGGGLQCAGEFLSRPKSLDEPEPKITSRLLLVGGFGRAHRLDDLAELRQGGSVLRTHRSPILASRIRSLQGTGHVAGDRNGIASMVNVADQVPLGTGLDVTAEAVAAEAVVDFRKSARPEFRALLGHIELEELPVARGRVEALLTLHHHFGRDELQHRTHRIDPGPARLGDLHSALQIAGKVSDIEMPAPVHLLHAVKRFFSDGEAVGRTRLHRPGGTGEQQRACQNLRPTCHLARTRYWSDSFTKSISHGCSLVSLLGLNAGGSDISVLKSALYRSAPAKHPPAEYRQNSA